MVHRRGVATPTVTRLDAVGRSFSQLPRLAAAGGVAASLGPIRLSWGSGYSPEPWLAAEGA